MSLFQRLQRGTAQPQTPAHQSGNLIGYASIPLEEEVIEEVSNPTLQEVTEAWLNASTEEDVSLPEELPSIFTKTYTFDFRFTAPLFKTFNLGEDHLTNVSASDIVDYFKTFDTGVNLSFIDDRLIINAKSDNMVTLSHFSWSAESPLTYQELDGDLFLEANEMTYSNLILVPEHKEEVATSSQPVEEEPELITLDTTQYHWNFGGVEPVFDYFSWGTSVYYNLPVSQLADRMSHDPDWLDGGFALTIEKQEVTISRSETTDEIHINGFAWTTHEAVGYKETAKAPMLYAKQANYDEVYFLPEDFIQPVKTIYAVRADDENAVWESLGELVVGGVRTHKDLSVLPEGMNLSLQTIDLETELATRLVLIGELPKESIRFQAALIEDSDLLDPIFVAEDKPAVTVVTPNEWEDDVYILPELTEHKYVTVITPNLD